MVKRNSSRGYIQERELFKMKNDINKREKNSEYKVNMHDDMHILVRQ